MRTVNTGDLWRCAAGNGFQFFFREGVFLCFFVFVIHVRASFLYIKYLFRNPAEPSRFFSVTVFPKEAFGRGDSELVSYESQCYGAQPPLQSSK